MSKHTKARNWCFTLNNPSQTHATYADLYCKHVHFRYLVFQLEKGEDGTPHYQGYVQFTSQMRLSGLKKVDPQAHWEPRKGSHKQAVEYCKKADTRVEGPWEYGNGVVQGSRSDLRVLYEDIKNGTYN